MVAERLRPPAESGGPPASAPGHPRPPGGLLCDPGLDATSLGDLIDDEVAADLNVDQIVGALAGKREEPDFLTRTFYAYPRDIEVVGYRQEVFRDLEAPALREGLQRSCATLRGVRAQLAQLQRMGLPQQRDGWFLDAAGRYCEAITELVGTLSEAKLGSRGLRAFRETLADYAAAEDFATLRDDARSRAQALAAIRYCVHIRGTRVRVSRYAGEADYSAQVLATFERFQQDAPADYRVTYRAQPALGHVGEQILTRVARLFPEEFEGLAGFCREHSAFYDDAVRTFEREIDFYLAYLDYIGPLRAAGLAFCYPTVVATGKEVAAEDTFDLALASQLVAGNRAVVANSFQLEGAERVIVVTGPNQGGKTTFARTFGQLHHLAGIGCPVPGTTARLPHCDRIYTHFERAEDPVELVGKLEADLHRITQVLQTASGRSIVILNELFAATTLADARFLGTKVLSRIIALDLLCVCVTFVDELATLGESVVSMVSTVVPEDPSERTYRIVRARADGLAYALAIAEKYGLTYDQLRGRLAR